MKKGRSDGAALLFWPKGWQGGAEGLPRTVVAVTYDQALRTGIQLAQEGRLDDAIGVFLQVQQAVPDNPHTHRLIGHVLFRAKNDPGAARPFFEEAVRRSPDADVVYDLLSTLMAMRLVLEVCRTCDQFREVVWSDPRLLAAWGYCLTELDRQADAIPVLRRALELSPADLNIPRNLSRALAASGQEEEAVRVFTTLAQPWDGVSTPNWRATITVAGQRQLG